MPNSGDPRDKLFYPTLTLMKDSYIDIHFKSLQLTPFRLEKPSVRKMIF